jgi:CheY-like chemotaxis protein
MNAVIGISELALRENPNPKIRDYIVRIKQAGTSLLSIINDILDFSRIESGKMEIHPGRYSLSSLLNDVVTIIGVRLHEKSLQFKVDIENNMPGTLFGDEIRIRQILINLLSNAVKYTKQGYIEFTVTSEFINSDTVNIKFVVADSGIGIKDDDLKNIFGNFTRFDMDRNRDIEGSGLGLAITHNLCRLMGGVISVSSVYSKGSTFSVVLPQKIVDSKPLSHRISPNGNYASDQPVAIQFTVPEARVLIVDDISSNLLVAEGLLAPYRMQIDCCSGGAEALKLAEAKPYDLILMDHLMPGMDGIEAVKRIRSSEKIRKSLPIVALTANAVTGMKEMFLENGFDDYLSKPIEISKLNDVIRKWIPRDKRKPLTGNSTPRPAVKKEAEIVSGAAARAEAESEVPEAAALNALSEDLPLFSIEGLDAAKGVEMTGGTESAYRQVLAIFCKDAAERMLLLKAFPGEPELAAFVINVHALKSISGTIGAAQLSKQAADLEAAGKAGDLDTIRKEFPQYYGGLQKLTEDIRQVLALTEPPGKIRENSGSESPGGRARELLGELRSALEAEDIKNIDRILEELTKQPLGEKTMGVLAAVSDQVLLAEFKAAIAMLDTLTASNF